MGFEGNEAKASFKDRGPQGGGRNGRGESDFSRPWLALWSARWPEKQGWWGGNFLRDARGQNGLTCVDQVTVGIEWEPGEPNPRSPYLMSRMQPWGWGQMSTLTGIGNLGRVGTARALENSGSTREVKRVQCRLLCITVPGICHLVPASAGLSGAPVPHFTWLTPHHPELAGMLCLERTCVTL